MEHRGKVYVAVIEPVVIYFYIQKKYHSFLVFISKHLKEEHSFIIIH